MHSLGQENNLTYEGLNLFNVAVGVKWGHDQIVVVVIGIQYILSTIYTCISHTLRVMFFLRPYTYCSFSSVVAATFENRM